jgi:hypothetical protein
MAFHDYGKLPSRARIDWENFLLDCHTENSAQNSKLLVNTGCLQRPEFHDSRFSANVLLLLQASPQVNFDLRRVNVQKLACSEHRFERLQRVLVRFMSFLGTNRRLGIVLQEEVGPFVERDRLALRTTSRELLSLDCRRSRSWRCASSQSVVSVDSRRRQPVLSR